MLFGWTYGKASDITAAICAFWSKRPAKDVYHKPTILYCKQSWISFYINSEARPQHKEGTS
jgi:hypothetical protein